MSDCSTSTALSNGSKTHPPLRRRPNPRHRHRRIRRRQLNPAPDHRFRQRKGACAFQCSIVQSPGFQYISLASQEAAYQAVLAQANVNSLAELKALPSETLQTVNALLISNATPWATAPFAPVVDGTFMPDYPPVLLANGAYDQSIRLMTAHNSDEGGLFASPFVRTDVDYEAYVAELFPPYLNLGARTNHKADVSGRLQW